MVVCICHLIFSATSATTHFFQKILCCAPCPQHNIFWKNNLLWQVCHNTLGLLFESQHIIFQKNIVFCAMSRTQYFLKKIMCCSKFVTTHYFLSHNTDATCAPIANPPNSAQQGGIPYHYPKLLPGPCSSLGMRPRTDRQTHTRVTTIHFASSTTHAKCNENWRN